MSLLGESGEVLKDARQKCGCNALFAGFLKC